MSAHVGNNEVRIECTCKSCSFRIKLYECLGCDITKLDTLFLVFLQNIHSLTPWHYSPDGHKPPLIRFHSLIFSVFEEQVANLLPQHFFESAWFINRSHLVAKQENIMGEKWVRKYGRQSILIMLCRVLLHAVNLRHGTNGFTSPPKEVRARDFFHP
jgi:hypothetical protein